MGLHRAYNHSPGHFVSREIISCRHAVGYRQIVHVFLSLRQFTKKAKKKSKIHE